jgi:hypothetical protein
MSDEELLEITKKIECISKNENLKNVIVSSRVDRLKDLNVEGLNTLSLKTIQNEISNPVVFDLINMCIFSKSKKIYSYIRHWSNYLTYAMFNNTEQKKYEDFIIENYNCVTLNNTEQKKSEDLIVEEYNSTIKHKYIFCTIAIGEKYFKSACDFAKKLNEKSDKHKVIIVSDIEGEKIKNCEFVNTPKKLTLFYPSGCFNYNLKYYPIKMASKKNCDYVLYFDADWKVAD